MKNTFVEQYQQLMLLHDDKKPALIFGDQTITFGELRANIEKYRNALIGLNVKPGARIAYSLPTCPEILYIAFAMSEIGGCLVPLHPATPPPFMAKILGYSRTEQLIVPKGSPLCQMKELPCKVLSLDTLEATSAAPNQIPEPTPESLAFIISTSGTTAQPKFVPITQANLATVIEGTRAIIGPMDAFANGLTYILVFPLSSSGIMPTMAQLALGSTYVLTADVTPMTFLGLIDKWKVDGMQGPPAYFEMLASFPPANQFDLSSITRVNSGSDFVPNKLLFALKKQFKNIEHVGIGYGLAETSTIVMSWTAHHQNELDVPTNRFELINPEQNEISVRDKDGTQAPVGEKGELCIRGESVIDEYYLNPEATQKAFDDEGWFRTGDIAILEQSGQIQLLGRDKYTIKRGGRTISPVTISESIMENPGVSLAAVVGVPHPLFGEMIWAFVKCTPDGDVKEGDINAHCREMLPPYMKPDNIVFMPDIPRTPGVGKIDYEKLKQIGIEKLKEMTGESDE